MKIKIAKRVIEIRSSSWEDYNYCYNLAKRNMMPFYKKYKIKWNPKIYRENFNPKFVKILEYNGRRIGFYKLIFRENSWYGSDLQISKNFQGKGIGRRIMMYLEKSVKKKGGSTIKLRVFINNPAINLYKRIGYKVIKKQKDSYLMKKKLK